VNNRARGEKQQTAMDDFVVLPMLDSRQLVAMGDVNPNHVHYRNKRTQKSIQKMLQKRKIFKSVLTFVQFSLFNLQYLIIIIFFYVFLPSDQNETD
jgi:hypothetical protein